jgi:5-methyltetrahydrofolate--homocysteine methyltransferase
LLALLNAEQHIGLTLTDSDTLDPEHSTAALVVHHPDVTYFSAVRAA